MTRILGIDYGTKRVGLAVSDQEKNFATPLNVFANNNTLIKEIKKICRENEVGAIVIGESRDYKNRENPVMRDIRKFKSVLEKELSLPVYFEPEVLTTAQAAHLSENHAKLDSSAAALILQSYLDKEV